MKIPTPATLKKYGLTKDDFVLLYNKQEGKCPICGRLFGETVKPCIDHWHVYRWKKKSPAERRKYVRGLCCIYCNQRMLPKGMTRQKAINIVIYLEKFERRLATVSDLQALPEQDTVLKRTKSPRKQKKSSAQ